MEQQRKVQTIPATLTRFTATPLSAQKKRKVAGYARVSTDHDDQFTSYEAQIDYYTNYIKPKLNKEVYYTSMEEKQSWGRPSAARMSF